MRCDALSAAVLARVSLGQVREPPMRSELAGRKQKSFERAQEIGQFVTNRLCCV
jgi:hypothetical protein